MTRRSAATAASVAGAAVVGLVLRAWLLASRPVSADEAITGLMARRIRHGQLFTFFWGNAYGGGDQYVAAVVTAVSDTVAGLNTVATLCWAAVAVVVGRLAHLLGASGAVATVAGAVVWVWPGATFVNSTRELGIRSVAVVALAGLLLAARWASERPSAGRLAVVGLVGGIGWWASPEIAYGLAAAVGCGWAAWRPLHRLWAAGAGFLVGAAPWVATNVRTGFASLRPASSPDYTHLGYLGRLHVAIVDSIPMTLGLRLPSSGAWVGGRLGELAAVGVGVGAAALAAATLVRRSSSAPVRGLAVGVATFPLLHAAFPATGYWREGLYGVYLVPLLVALTVAGVPGRAPAGGCHATPPRDPRRARRVAPAIVALAGVTATCAATFTDAELGGHPGALRRGWGGDEGAALASLHAMEAAGVHDAYAEYWVAYHLDLLGGPRVALSDPNADRWVDEQRVVASSPDPAWVFFAPGALGPASAQFASLAQGPGGLTEWQFTAKLAALGVAYTTVPAGVLDVVEPVRAVTPAQVGLGPPVWPVPPA